MSKIMFFFVNYRNKQSVVNSFVEKKMNTLFQLKKK